MISKKILKPGMVVKIKRGDVCIIALDDSLNNKLKLSWDDGTNRSLYVENYTNKLMYPNHEEEYNIEAVYDLPLIGHPFTTKDFEKRPLLWKRDNKAFFSFREKKIARAIDCLFKDYFGCDGPIFIEDWGKQYVRVSLGDDSIDSPSLSLPRYLFPNITVEEEEKIPLDRIINSLTEI